MVGGCVGGMICGVSVVVVVGVVVVVAYVYVCRRCAGGWW